MSRLTLSSSVALTLALLAPLGRAAEPAAKLSALDYSGSPAAVEALDRELYAAGTDVAKLAAVEQRLLAALRAPDTTYAARQVICQRLGWVLGVGRSQLTAAGLKPLGTMLADERDSDLARLALEPAPGAEIDGMFLSALDKTAGRTRLALIDSVARRHLTAAVPALAKLLGETDAATAAAAAKALGSMTDLTAAAALQAVAEPSPAAVAAAKLALAPKLGAGAALALLAEVRDRAADPVNRAAALRILLRLDPSAAATVAVLDGTDWTFKQVALESIGASQAPGLVAALSAKLASWDGPTQRAAIAALARRGDAGATVAVAAAATHADATVRTAAIEGLGLLPGTRETAALLAKIAAGADANESKAAKASLARLNGSDVNTVILAGAESGEAALRGVYLEQVALRGLSEGLPLLVKLRADSDAAVRAAAVAALGDLAPPADAKLVLDWTVAATDANEQARALRALVNITLRNPVVADRGAALYAAIDGAESAVALRLLPALGRIGGAPSAAAAAKLAMRDDAKLAEAALAALTRWTDGTALDALTTVAEKAAIASVRAAAGAGVTTYFERNRAVWTQGDSTLVGRLLAVTTVPEARTALVALLNRAGDKTALALAEGLQADAAVGPAALEAAAVIRANLAGPAKVRASSMNGVSNLMDGKTGNRWTVPLEGEEWVEIDFKAARPVHRLTLDQTGRANEFPEGYEIYVTDDLAAPGKALATGTGQRNRTVINLPAGTRGRYVIIKNVAARKDGPWSICELFID
jgi:hypothetical protein